MGKISNGSCQPFEPLMKNFEWLTKNFEQMMPAVRTADEKFQMDDASRLNG